MSLHLGEARSRIIRYLDALEDLARAVDTYLMMVTRGYDAGADHHREDVAEKLERVRETAALLEKEGTER